MYKRKKYILLKTNIPRQEKRECIEHFRSLIFLELGYSACACIDFCVQMNLVLLMLRQRTD